MDFKINELWETIIGSKKDLTPEQLYVLLKPEDRKAFMEILDTELFSYEEKVQGIRFLIEYEKPIQQTLYIPSNPITSPNYPSPSYPSYPTTDPMPWQSPIIYCTHTGDGIGHFYAQTTTCTIPKTN